LKGINWTGLAYTADGTTGDESKRARVFHFCLIHNAQALCGETPVVWLVEPKVSELWKVKAILEPGPVCRYAPGQCQWGVGCSRTEQPGLVALMAFF
jgi:hypothetical protein